MAIRCPKGDPIAYYINENGYISAAFNNWPIPEGVKLFKTEEEAINEITRPILDEDIIFSIGEGESPITKGGGILEGDDVCPLNQGHVLSPTILGWEKFGLIKAEYKGERKKIKTDLNFIKEVNHGLFPNERFVIDENGFFHEISYGYEKVEKNQTSRITNKNQNKIIDIIYDALDL